MTAEDYYGAISNRLEAARDFYAGSGPNSYGEYMHNLGSYNSPQWSWAGGVGGGQSSFQPGGVYYSQSPTYQVGQQGQLNDEWAPPADLDQYYDEPLPEGGGGEPSVGVGGLGPYGGGFGQSPATGYPISGPTMMPTWWSNANTGDPGVFAPRPGIESGSGGYGGSFGGYGGSGMGTPGMGGSLGAISGYQSPFYGKPFLNKMFGSGGGHQGQSL